MIHSSYIQNSNHENCMGMGFISIGLNLDYHIIDMHLRVAADFFTREFTEA